MELNREQAIEILERFDFFQGQRSGRELWNSKPFEVQDQDIANFSRDVALLKNYINELTQANEMLSESYDHLEKTKDELLAERSRLTEENERLQRICKLREKDHNDTLDLLYKSEEENERLKAELEKRPPVPTNEGRNTHNA